MKAIFREAEIYSLIDKIKHRHSVELVGIKRVGINYFLKYFLSQYNRVSKDKYQLFIFVDLNDLIERDFLPFWRLTLKRITETVEKSRLSEETKKKVSQLFIRSIQTEDVFLSYDYTREALVFLSSEVYPTIFFSRFDRLKNTVTLEFLNNLESLIDSTNRKLCYLFTSFRDFSKIFSSQFAENHLNIFSSVTYIRPANYLDCKFILSEFMEKHEFIPSKKLAEFIIEDSGGHAHYLQLLLIILDEMKKDTKDIEISEYKEIVEKDERVRLLSEEIWESLSVEEQSVLKCLVSGSTIHLKNKQKAKYLWDSGMVKENNDIFRPLFKRLIQKKKRTHDSPGVEFTKKENILFSILRKNINHVCERDEIVNQVWPEYKDYGVSDWTIDKLVGRLRNKLKKQHSTLLIVTVRTRGYKLISE